ncbi:magnesium transporter CorA family protein [Sporosarcina gallistercoris]|uniref:Magnesium transporter CorA family protein n=1 Tax=Sporosarcina gallistercoris TaxID=2762245 RepID=A0ABR8PHH3_9BACL|nr:magnesium transporter CorA family protein [Sporosarcina gallistercoris]MBD7907616.1 magnesium transporter CorA family protein [Sporosarcina gallistercoris]
MYFSYKQDNWEWIEVEQQTDLKTELSKQSHMSSKWLDTLEKNKQDVIGNSTAVPDEEALWGRLTYEQSMQSKNDNRTFSFFLTKDTLLTSDLDQKLFPEEARAEMEQKLNDSENALQAFVVLLNAVLHKFLEQIDHFEYRLREMIWDIKDNNNMELLERIAQSRHELIIWNNLVIPLVETQMTLEETFDGEQLGALEYKRLCTRIKRIRILIREYSQEVEALTDMESLVSNQRGNEIMKTLTVITTIFTPAAVFGAIWGMNFKSIPEFEWAHGYAFALTVILSTTLGLYFYLKKKGWMGEILKTKSNKSIFK